MKSVLKEAKMPTIGLASGEIKLKMRRKWEKKEKMGLSSKTLESSKYEVSFLLIARAQAAFHNPELTPRHLQLPASVFKITKSHTQILRATTLRNLLVRATDWSNSRYKHKAMALLESEEMGTAMVGTLQVIQFLILALKKTTSTLTTLFKAQSNTPKTKLLKIWQALAGLMGTTHTKT